MDSGRTVSDFTHRARGSLLSTSSPTLSSTLMMVSLTMRWRLSVVLSGSSPMITLISSLKTLSPKAVTSEVPGVRTSTCGFEEDAVEPVTRGNRGGVPTQERHHYECRDSSSALWVYVLIIRFLCPWFFVVICSAEKAQEEANGQQVQVRSLLTGCLVTGKDTCAGRG